MTQTAESSKRMGWLAQLVDGAHRAFAFRKRSAAGKAERTTTQLVRKRRKTARRRTRATRKPERTAADVARLSAAGADRTEIARRTGLSQDTVSLLMNLANRQAEESAGSGTFFRTLQAKLAS